MECYYKTNVFFFIDRITWKHVDLHTFSQTNTKEGMQSMEQSNVTEIAIIRFNSWINILVNDRETRPISRGKKNCIGDINSKLQAKIVPAYQSTWLNPEGIVSRDALVIRTLGSFPKATYFGQKHAHVGPLSVIFFWLQSHLYRPKNLTTKCDKWSVNMNIQNIRFNVCT